MSKKPFLISFEGMDGCGKFTQATMLKKWLEEKGKTVGTWAEPNDEHPIGQAIRRYLNRKSPLKLENYEFQRMFVIDRAQNIFHHYHDGAGDDFKIADRYALSTIAFGMLTGTPEDFIKLHHDVVGTSMVWPDLTIILDISPETSVARINARKFGEKAGIEGADRNENYEIQEKVRRNYLEIAKRTDIGKIVVINGERPPEEIFEDIKKEVSAHFGL